MLKEKIYNLLKLKEFSDGQMFEITVNGQEYQGILIQGNSNLKNNSQIIVENNLEIFHLREDDEDDMVPKTIEKIVFVNKFGEFILDKGELQLRNHATSQQVKDDFYEEIDDYDFE